MPHERTIQPRNPPLAFDASLPRHWLGDNVAATAIANGVNILFPAGERFFVRSVSRYLERIESPKLREQMKGFFGQEGHHARAHEQLSTVLESQGYPIDAFLRFYEWLAYRVIERISPAKLCLATTAACEHFTALLAEDALKNETLDLAHPAIGSLLRWHAAEEIEHRAVAFDVLREIAPGQGWRLAGLAMATATLAGFWFLATTTLLFSDRKVGLRRIAADFARVRERRQGRGVFLKGIAAYVRRDFHPSRVDLDSLARDYLQSAGMA